MAPIVLKIVREAPGLSRQQRATALHVSPRAVDDREADRRPSPDAVRIDVARIEARS